MAAACVRRDAIPFSILLAHWNASLPYKEAMLRAERLSAIAVSVTLLPIRSYHGHESGFHAKDVVGDDALVHGRR